MSSILYGCFVGRSLYHFALFDTSSASFIGDKASDRQKNGNFKLQVFTTRAQIKLDCKTVRIFAYLSTREQSNKAENRERDWGETLKILSPHTPLRACEARALARVRLLRHALPISLLILRKKPTFLQSKIKYHHLYYEK